jgi:hypothetical protein
VIGLGRDILRTVLSYLDNVIFIEESIDGRTTLI